MINIHIIIQFKKIGNVEVYLYHIYKATSIRKRESESNGKNVQLSLTHIYITNVKSVKLYNFRSRDEYYAQYSVSRILLYPTIMKLECTCAN